MTRLRWCGAVTILAVGCTHHILPYEPKVRDYAAADYAAVDVARTEGSLWSEGAPGLFEDVRARRVGDIVTVVVDERSDATRDARTQTQRQADVSMGISSFFAAMERLASQHPGLSPEMLIGATQDSSFDGGGSTARSGKLAAILPVRIRRTLPNGDFYVEGAKVLLLNDEESQLYLSGVIRPVDISPDNTISSAVMADVELEYTGRGVVTERQNVGWLARLLDYVWPF